ncbi:uncharacterized protein E5676_scaffold259G00270 [Cucumis melo var. makuwa]|uniref:Uncharacterized protein n=1 Tax=Cucumis melo var. makuwa TaxID=1194695 RepID=A0A5A7VF37_CUCMM|nr:uncharacterized protein E6C27_scaffold538G00970 [Cucumis melo var. makuwa]TYK15101.1 uncharacterized protein E5676_scaffold259G00270 [Cucumis melo var. makuwa]
MEALNCGHLRLRREWVVYVDPNRGKSYRLWSGTLKHKETFKLSAFFVWKGTKIRFWKDNWCGVEPLAENFPNLFSLSLNNDAFVADCWCIITHSWNLRLRRNVLDNKLDNVASILEILHSWAPSDSGDSRKWTPNVNGSFTMKNTFLSLTKRSPSIAVPLSRHIWETKIPKKCEILLMVACL